jgi:hypothetical protein
MSRPAAESIKMWLALRRPLVLVLLGVAGCSGSQPLPPAANPDRAREGLQAALDAWQKGETVESLQKQEPAIHVNDPDWRENKKLVKYQIGTGQFHGQSWRCEVQLTLQDSAGKSTPRQVKYIIDTDPTVVVVRD